jgi:hypothetical protein
VTPLQINVASRPVRQIPCSTTPGQGPINIRGHVRAVATNGGGAQVKSKTFVFEFIPPRWGETSYMADCREHEVPVPPDWSLQTTRWKLQGNLKDGTNLLDETQSQGQDAFVWTWSDPAIRGACIALPRSGVSTRALLAGIICQSAYTGYACFWDSRLRNEADPMAESDKIDWTSQTLVISKLKDATNLTETGSGVCTDCHRGNNVFLISPDDPTWAKVLRGPLVTAPGSTFTTQVLASSDNRGGHPRFVPLAGNRAGWTNEFAPLGGDCNVCHENPDLPFSKRPVMPPACPPSGSCYP